MKLTKDVIATLMKKKEEVKNDEDKTKLFLTKMY